MDIPNRFLSVSSPRKFVGLLTLTLLLINAYSVKAQDATPTATATATATPRATPTATPSPTPTPTPTPVSAEDSRQNKLVDSIWFPTVIILMFGIVLIGFAYTITRAIRFSKETFRSKSGLPEGSLRAMLAFMLVALLGFYVLASILSFSPSFRPPDFLLGIVATVIGKLT